MVGTPDRSTLTNAGGTINLSGTTTDANTVLSLNFLGFSSTLQVSPIISTPLAPWSWRPESGSPLTSPKINMAGMEQTVTQLLSEWLAGYFNGGTHYLFAGTTFAQFPAIKAIIVNQEQIPQPLEGGCIQIVLADPGYVTLMQQGGVWIAKSNILVDFQIRAQLKQPLANGWNAFYMARTVSDLLLGLLLDRGATIPLQNAGFRKLRPRSPVAIQNTLYQFRLVRCAMQAWALAPASFTTTSPLGSDEGGQIAT